MMIAWYRHIFGLFVLLLVIPVPKFPPPAFPAPGAESG
jgi:hypothetical protein